MFACCCAAAEGSGSVERVVQVAPDDRHGDADPEVRSAAAIEEVPPLLAPAASGSTAVPASFKVTLAKDTSNGKGTTGWRLDCVAQDSLHVFEVRKSNSPIAAYNATVGPERQILVGDYIKSINGHTAVNTMAEMADKEDVLELVVQRPHIFTLSFDKQGGALGMELKYWYTGTTVLVGGVRNGEVRKQGVDLLPGDRIISVNGACGSSTVLLNRLKSMQKLELLVSRCP